MGDQCRAGWKKKRLGRTVAIFGGGCLLCALAVTGFYLAAGPPPPAAKRPAPAAAAENLRVHGGPPGPGMAPVAALGGARGGKLPEPLFSRELLEAIAYEPGPGIQPSLVIRWEDTDRTEKGALP